MKRLLAAVALIVLALLPVRLAADPADIAAASRAVVRVVLISQDQDGVGLVGHGSGFAVSPTLVVTNAHVVAPMAGNPGMRVGLVPSRGKTGYFARIVAYSPRQDLALLRLAEPGSLVPATLFTGPVADGQEVWAVGYPGNVDAAQGFSAADYMTPTAPVKTHGSVSAGRSGRGFDTILHTAQIAAGNSGGPLLDLCGRVIGANSFGTEMSGGADSNFYFAVSMQEISRFLIANNVKASLTGEPCRSQAEYLTAEEQRLAAESLRNGELSRAEAARRDAALAKATRQAEFDVFSERENRMALAGLCLLLAAIAGGAAMRFGQLRKDRERKIAAISALVLLVMAVAAWLARPSLSDIDERAKELAAQAEPSAAASESPVPAGEGKLTCVIVPERSRITVSSTADVPLEWKADGCVNGKTQYGLSGDGWSRILAPNSEDTVSIAAYDPVSRTYRTDRYLLDAETMAKVREARARYSPPQCGIGESAARQLGDSQSAVKALLPGQPNERLVYKCEGGQ